MENGKNVHVKWLSSSIINWPINNNPTIIYCNAYLSFGSILATCGSRFELLCQDFNHSTKFFSVPHHLWPVKVIIFQFLEKIFCSPWRGRQWSMTPFQPGKAAFFNNGTFWPWYCPHVFPLPHWFCSSAPMSEAPALCKCPCQLWFL